MLYIDYYLLLSLNLYYSGGSSNERGVYVASLSNPSGRRLLSDFTSALYSPPSSGRGTGHLLFLREGTLVAQPFDVTTLELSDAAFSVATGASVSSTAPQAFRKMDCLSISRIVQLKLSCDGLIGMGTNLPQQVQGASNQEWCSRQKTKR